MSRTTPQRRYVTARTRAQAALAAAVLITACAAYPEAQPVLPSERYKPIVRETFEQAVIAIPDRGQGLAADDIGELRGLARIYRARGHGPVTLAAPANAPDGAAVAGAVAEARDILDAAGVASRNVVGQVFQDINDPEPRILAYFTTYIADTPPCHQTWDDFGDTSRPNTINFGCAVQSNLAVMIADPYDLVAPRDQDPADPVRRSIALEAYREGESTATDRSSDERVVLSDSIE